MWTNRPRFRGRTYRPRISKLISRASNGRGSQVRILILRCRVLLFSEYADDRQRRERKPRIDEAKPRRQHIQDPDLPEPKGSAVKHLSFQPPCKRAGPIELQHRLD